MRAELSCYVGGRLSVTLLLDREWRFLLTDLGSAAVTSLEGLASAREVTPALNLPLTISCSVPSDDKRVNIGGDAGDPFVDYNDRFLYAFRREGTGLWMERGATILMQIEDESGTEAPRSHLTGYDPWMYLNSRPIRRDDFALPTNVISFTGIPGSTIALNFLLNTDQTDGNAYIDYGQTAFYGGTIETTAELDIDFDQATSVGEAWSELCATGTMDIVLNPIYDPIDRPGIIAELSIYASAGSSRDAAIFGWDRIPRSLVGVSHLMDGSRMANKVVYYSTDGRKGVLEPDAASIAKYGQWWAQETSPGQASRSALDLLALAQVLIRRRGKETLTISTSPMRSPWPLRDYGLGDCVPVYISKALRSAYESDVTLGCVPGGLKRIYAIPIKIDDDGMERVEGLLVSEPDT